MGKSKGVYNIGYNSGGKHQVNINGKQTKVYTTWKSMFVRCYSKINLLDRPTYIGCYVINEWHDFQVFADWFYENYTDGWELDKDILVKGNKVYGPETCCFVPKEVNQIFTSVRKGKYPIGVSFHRNNQKFISQIKIFNVKKYLGSWETIEEAFNAYAKEYSIYMEKIIFKHCTLSENVKNSIINKKIYITD
jgi:hypothetical protein